MRYQKPIVDIRNNQSYKSFRSNLRSFITDSSDFSSKGHLQMKLMSVTPTVIKLPEYWAERPYYSHMEWGK